METSANFPGNRRNSATRTKGFSPGRKIVRLHVLSCQSRSQEEEDDNVVHGCLFARFSALEDFVCICYSTLHLTCYSLLQLKERSRGRTKKYSNTNSAKVNTELYCRNIAHLLSLEVYPTTPVAHTTLKRVSRGFCIARRTTMGQHGGMICHLPKARAPCARDYSASGLTISWVASIPYQKPRVSWSCARYFASSHSGSSHFNAVPLRGELARNKITM